MFRTTSEYTPDEIQQEYDKKRLQDMSTWVDTFSISGVFWMKIIRIDWPDCMATTDSSIPSGRVL